jgi:NAD(P)-dependent dehydrogenase (short-subunit alcohol dehydrogenase family)
MIVRIAALPIPCGVMSAASHPSDEQPVALVTGAGSGIGRAICILLARERVRIAMVGRTQRTLDETAQAIVAEGGRESEPLTIAADIAQPSEARGAIDRVVDQWGRLDILINNAGAVEAVPIEQTTRELLDRMFAVNVFGPAHLIARAWPIFVAQQGGCVVNVSTMSTIDPFPGL